jgi:hypothetical protein
MGSTVGMILRSRLHAPAAFDAHHASRSRFIVVRVELMI